jgi:hypothetical protein
VRFHKAGSVPVRGERAGSTAGVALAPRSAASELQYLARTPLQAASASMSERDTGTPDPAVPEPTAERRSRRDRRAGGGPSRRGRVDNKWKRVGIIVGRDAAMVVITLAAIVVGIRITNPIFANQPKVVESLVENAPITKAVLDTMAPERDTLRAAIVATPEFERDRQAFAADLVATGHMDPARADTVSYYAVREAYLRGIPPAVVFGVMLTENSRFVSKALSNVGAVGLMQVYPKVWLKALQEKFGADLATDSTNLKYGVYILSTYSKTEKGAAQAAVVNKGLLRYNGCVRGTNTPHCKNYPSKVAGYVKSQGNSICGNKSFYDCIAKPFVEGFTGSRDVE